MNCQKLCCFPEIFTYGPDNRRVKRVDYVGQDLTTTYYVGNVQFINKNGIQHVRRSIGVIVEVSELHDGLTRSVKDYTYFFKDHLGSIVATSNHLGSDVEQLSFDAWGQRRTANWMPSTPSAEQAFSLVGKSNSLIQPLLINKGFTGHEHVDAVGIIHMNGRIYDPTLGRFLQADPHIQAPNNSQNYNRYSYVLNNPMSMTDPSGYFFDKIFKGLNKVLGDFAPFAGMALMFIPGVGQWAAASMWNAAAIGFVSGGVATGSLKGAVIGAISGAAFQGIGKAFRGMATQNAANGVQGLSEFGGNMLTSGQIAGQVASHAAAGGVISVLSGGKFGHGFFSAGFTKAAGGSMLPGGSDLSTQEIIGGTIASAVIGGTASVLSGGKFTNGARTASYQYLFNQAGKANSSNKKSGSTYTLDEKQAKRVLQYFYGKDDGLTIDESLVSHAERILDIAFKSSSSFSKVDKLGALFGGTLAATSIKDVILNSGIDLAANEGDVSSWKVLFQGSSMDNPYVYNAVRYQTARIYKHEYHILKMSQ